MDTESVREFATRTNRPIPGQSLTNDVDTPAPYERPPEFTTKEEAANYFFKLITAEENFDAFMDLLSDGVPVMNIVQVLLTKSFEDGEINPDMMLMLAEPLAYILLGLAEREGIKAVIVDDEEEKEKNTFRAKLQTIKNPKDDEEVPMVEKIQEVPSLMSRSQKGEQ